MQFKDDIRSKASPRWLEKAKRNLDSAFLNHRHGGYTDTTCYFAHQVAELVIKAFIVHPSLSFKKTHDLILLKNICLKQDKELEDLTENLAILNRYYIENKYPSDFPTDYPKERAEEAIKLAEEIFEFVKKKIK